MRIARTLPPAAAPIPWSNITRACFSILSESGSPIETFRQEIRDYFSVDYCSVVSSGKAALTLLLQALHEIFPARDEVLIPAFTCFSVPAAIKKAGLKIKLCDLDPATLDFDRSKLQHAAEADEQRGRLLCVIPTHLFGVPADVDHCRGIFTKEVTIIEDAAQAMAGEWRGKKIGCIGDAGFFSLGRGKSLSAMEGGIIITNRGDIGGTLERMTSTLPQYTVKGKAKLLSAAILTSIFLHPSLFWLPKAMPFLRLGETIYQPDFAIRRLSSTHSALAGDWRSRLQISQRARADNIRYFSGLVRDKTAGQNKFESSLFSCFNKEQPLIRLPALADTREIRDRAADAAAELGLGIMPPYPAPINEIPGLADDFSGEHYPVAKILSEQLLTIPTHEYMKEKDYQTIYTLLYDRVNLHHGRTNL